MHPAPESPYRDDMSRRVHLSPDSAYEPVVGYARAVRAGDLIAVSGTTAPGHTVSEQTRNALVRIENALLELGGSLADVVRIRMFVTDISRWREIGAVHAEFFGAIRPAATMVEVSALIEPQLLIEIEADAYVVG